MLVPLLRSTGASDSAIEIGNVAFDYKNVVQLAMLNVAHTGDRSAQVISLTLTLT